MNDMINVRARIMHEPAKFFTGVRKVTGRLDDIQVQVINRLLRTAGHWNIGFLAYGLATGWHEARLKPVKEKGSRAYLSKYDTGRLAKILGNTPEADVDGILYAGRGLPQITGLANYKKASKELGIDLVKNPDLALDPNIAVDLMVWGMSEGAYTGKRLSDYISSHGTWDEFVRARRIINGTDRAEMIAEYAMTFREAIIDGGWR